MKKIVKDYIEEYGDIPTDQMERIDLIADSFNMNRCKSNISEYISKISSIKWKSYSFTIYLLPKATPRPRLGINGVFYVKGAADNKAIFKEYLLDKDIPLITTPTKFRCVSYLPIPKTMKPIEKLCAELGFIYPVSKPDWDNLGKAYCDMLQDVILYDDSLVIEGISRKLYSIKPRIEITVSYMEDYDSAYNKNKIYKKGK